MHFGKKLKTNRFEPWSQFYLDYGQLKSLLKEDETTEALQQLENGQTDPTSSFHHHQEELTISCKTPSLGSLSAISSHWSQQGLPSFVKFLNDEVERILFFFLQEQARVASELESCRQDQLILQRQDSSTWFTSVEETIVTMDGVTPAAAMTEDDVLLYKFSQVAVHLLRLIHYVDLNVTGIRKILKKHDKRFHSNLSTTYLGKRATILQPLLSNDSIDALIKILESSLREWNDFCAERQKLVLGETTKLGKVEEVSERGALSENSVDDKSNETGDETIPIGSLSPEKLAQRQQHETKPMSDYNATTTTTEGPKPANPRAVLYQIRAARSRLQETGEFIKTLAAPMLVYDSMIGSEEGDDEDRSTEEETEQDEAQERTRAISNFLNLMSTFLYMTNYYIVAPASNTYAEKLGGSASDAGIIIGMTPVAALVSTLLYSWWTSYSYKAALIFASICSLAGNLFYGAGLPADSMKFVLIGRLLNGFGSARSINRRYIADSFNRRDRTAASAAFVTAGALGMAVGPAIAALLEFSVPHDNDSPFWQVENAPGWIMFVVWTVYLVFLICFFQDPPRRHKKNKVNVKLTGEKQSLLAENEATDKTSDSEEVVITTEKQTIHDYIAVIVTFIVYFVLKLVLESILSSSPMISAHFFGWTGKISGMFLAILGLMLLPANWLVSYLSMSYEDRELVLVIQVAMLVGCLAVMNIYSDVYTVPQYVVASLLIFVSTNALEGPNMSLLSKTIPRSWSEGFFNVGLLATEAGTLGRAIGDVLLTACGAAGMESLLNRIFGLMSALSLIGLALSYRFYSYLIPKEKDD